MRPVLLLLVLPLAWLSGACERFYVPSSAPRPYVSTDPVTTTDAQPRVATISPVQIAKLDELTGEATEADVVAILGAPSFRTDKSMFEQASKDLDKDFKELYVDSLPAYLRDNEADVVLSYQLTGPLQGGEARHVGVFFRNGRFRNYDLSDSTAFLPAEKLDQAKVFMDSPSRQKMRVALGLPNGMGGPLGCEYKFSSPEPLAAIGCETISMKWLEDGTAGLKFWGLSTEFTWRADAFDGGAVEMARMPQLAAEYQAFATKEVQSRQHVDSGPQFDRARAILRKLEKHAQSVQITGPVGPFPLIILKDAKINALTRRQGKNIEIILYTGLLDRMDDDELACVLAHEIGHVTRFHTYIPISWALQMIRSKPLFRWSQMMEHEADISSTDLAARAGYSPAAADRALDILEKDSPSPRSELVTHPIHKSRQVMLRWYRQYRGIGEPATRPVSQRSSPNHGKAVDAQ